MASVLASASPVLCDSLDDSLFVNLASADELFHNGQIRPKFPLFVEDDSDGGSPPRPPLKKLFVERRDISSPALAVTETTEWNRTSPPVGSYGRWTNKKTAEVLNRRCAKSNSTGFSKLWRLRDLKLRSNSDGKDAFVFLTANSKKRTSSAAAETEIASNVKGTAEKKNSGDVKNETVRNSKSKTVSYGPEKHYVMIKARKANDKRRSYLPYKQNLVGFFTNVNGFSRNVHPY